MLSTHHTEELFRLIDANREHLREWLPWVDANRSPADTESFIRSAINQHESGKGPQYAVFYSTVMCGVCGFHPFDVTNRIGGIGYWLGRAYAGQGVMTLSVRALVEAGFREYGLNRIDIACATGNARSRAIPERLGFTFEGILREREYLHGRSVDHAVYSMWASESRLTRRRT
ncbi:GNAT family N-acetyltransferase [Aquisalimonas asiatica]|uniref:GNAT family N-acetyltransferase n=1 Tax=Aquisalimonas asiatica TaxID=406100 RepID=UPI003CCBD69A